ncbi:unnamed protein product [Schistocephalus solidus]|uniref:G_PROTEIN_RECEP_F1_2 domain-containing protein n=1 Tax=Schistocephalus solidus TaxID=70667 RepID=A0A183SIW2_SCHSO|nr:unnamed protein product [Schistocephalus solidus]
MPLEEDHNWLYVDSPWDLLRDCKDYQTGNSTKFGACVLSHILGITSAYIFPIVGTFGVVSNFLVFYVFLFVFRRSSRQMIYLGCVAIADMMTIVSFGWMWMFPAKGLPYATSGRVYFFVLNVNDLSCKVFRYVYSFTSCLSSSLFLVTACDRCLCVYFPLKFSRLSKKRAWQAVGLTILCCSLLMLPYPILARHDKFQGKMICWVHEGEKVLQIYHVLLANSSLLQTFLVIIVNIALVIRLRQSAALREAMSKCVSVSKEIAASMLLVILSTMVVICALPQSVAYILSTILAKVLEGEHGRMVVRMTFNVSDLGWHLLFFQQSFNWLLYMKRMKNFRRANMKLLQCHCRFAQGMLGETFGSVHYLSTRARYVTSEVRNARVKELSTVWTVSEFGRVRPLDVSGLPESRKFRDYISRPNPRKVFPSFNENVTITTKF